MFDALSDRLNDVFDRLRRHGALSEDDVASAMREIRVALLEADVALPVVKDFVNAVREKAIGQEGLRSVTPAQMVVKIVHDHLVETLGGAGAAGGAGWVRRAQMVVKIVPDHLVETLGGAGAAEAALNLNAVPPVVVMMV